MRQNVTDVTDEEVEPATKWGCLVFALALVVMGVIWLNMARTSAQRFGELNDDRLSANITAIVTDKRSDQIRVDELDRYLRLKFVTPGGKQISREKIVIDGLYNHTEIGDKLEVRYKIANPADFYIVADKAQQKDPWFSLVMGLICLISGLLILYQYRPGGAFNEQKPSDEPS